MVGDGALVSRATGAVSKSGRSPLLSRCSGCGQRRMRECVEGTMEG